MKKYLVLLIIISLLPSALCMAAIYTDEGPDHSWNTNNNWDPSIPGSGEDAEMSVDNTTCIVETGDDIECRGLFVGCYGAENKFIMDCGTLDCTWLNIGRGADPNQDGGFGTFEMSCGTINTESMSIPEQFAGIGGVFTRGQATMTGGTINVSGANFVIGDRIHGKFSSGYGTLEMQPGALITINSPRTVDPTDPTGPGIPSFVEVEIIDDLLDGYITADTDTVYEIAPGEFIYPSAMMVVDANEAGIFLRAEDTTLQQTYDPVPGSWVTDEYTLSSQTTTLGWSTAPSMYKEYLYFSEDEDLVANKDFGLRTDVTSSGGSYSVGSLEMGKTYHWQVETRIGISGYYSGQVWHLRVPNSIKVDDFDGYTGTWTDSGSAVSFKKDNTGLRYSPDGKNLKITVGAGLSGEVSSVPAGSDWSVKNVGGLYVDVYGNDLNDPGVTLTVTLNDTASVTYSGPLDTVYDEDLNARVTWKIPVGDFGISMSNITKIAFSVDNTSGAGDAVVHVADIRLVAEECLDQPDADVSGDCVVDLDDVRMVAIDWLTNGLGLPE